MAETVGFAMVLRHPVFARLFVAETQSVVGDQLARVALSILVFDATRSAALTAGAYALTFLPAVLGGSLFSGLPQRWGDRRTMIACDILRAALFAFMALPGVPVPLVAALLCGAIAVGPLFTAAEVSLLSRALGDGPFRTATGTRMIAGQFSQVAGFAFGGIVVAWIGPRGALGLNAATFAVSVALILGIRTVTAPAADTGSDGRLRGSARTILAIGGVPRLLALSALAGLYIVPEGLAVPFGDARGADVVGVGLLLAAIPLGCVVGIVVLVKRVPVVARERVFATMTMTCGLPLIVSGAVADWRIALVCWFATGVLSAHQVEAVSAMVRMTPAHLRARLVAFGTAVLIGAQGAGLVVFGLVANELGTPSAVTIAGALAVLAAAVLVLPVTVGSHALRTPLLGPRAQSYAKVS